MPRGTEAPCGFPRLSSQRISGYHSMLVRAEKPACRGLTTALNLRAPVLRSRLSRILLAAFSHYHFASPCLWVLPLVTCHDLTSSRSTGQVWPTLFSIWHSHQWLWITLGLQIWRNKTTVTHSWWGHRAGADCWASSTMLALLLSRVCWEQGLSPDPTGREEN